MKNLIAGLLSLSCALSASTVNAELIQRPIPTHTDEVDIQIVYQDNPTSGDEYQLNSVHAYKQKQQNDIVVFTFSTYNVSSTAYGNMGNISYGKQDYTGFIDYNRCNGRNYIPSDIVDYSILMPGDESALNTIFVIPVIASKSEELYMLNEICQTINK